MTTGGRRPVWGIVFLGLAVLLATARLGWKEAVPEVPPVALIGWDAATWDVIDPLLEKGRLPNLARLIRTGNRGTLVAEEPIVSPVVWTTLATGFRPTEHGVSEFQLPDPKTGKKVLAATFHRRRASLWQMVSRWGKTVGFVGWWTTWPAERANGYMVSDHTAYNRWDSWARRPKRAEYHLTFPPQLADELAAYAVRPDQLDFSELLRIVPLNSTEEQEMREADHPIVFHGPSVFRYGYSTDASNFEFAKHMLDSRKQPDLFAIVFILSDVAGHVFWHHHEPEKYHLDNDGHLKEAIPNIYEQLDRWMGEIVKRLAPNTRVILLSDHGMGANPEGTPPQPGRDAGGDHRPEGIIVVSGPGIRNGADLGHVSGLDLTPTVLGLLDLPLAKDMPGKQIEVLEAGHPAATVRWVHSYGSGSSGERPDVTSPSRKKYEERLRALGYIE